MNKSSSTPQFLPLFPYNINSNLIYICIILEALITTTLSSNPTKSSVPQYNQNNLPTLLLMVIPTIQISFQIHNKIEL